MVRFTGASGRPCSQTSSNAPGDSEFMESNGRFGERRLGRLGYFVVALPSFVFQLERLDGNGVRIGIEFRLRLKLRGPAAENLVGDRELAGFIVHLDNDVLAKILEGNF